MRSFKFLTVLGFVFIASMSLLFVGCGSDDNGPTTTAGSLTNPEFVALQGEIDNLVDSTLGFILTGMNSLGTISSGGNIDPILYIPKFTDSDQVSISYVNGWHVVNLTKSSVDFAFNIIDSVQFYSNNDISQVGVGADSMWYRHHWSYDVANTDVTYTSFAGDAGFDFRGLNDIQVVINGSNDLSVADKFVSVDSTVSRDFDFSTDVANLTISKGPAGWDQSCPSSGSIASTVMVSYTKDNGTPVLSTWSVSISFTDGSAAVSVRQGSVVWNYTTDVCTSIN